MDEFYSFKQWRNCITTRIRMQRIFTLVNTPTPLALLLSVSLCQGLNIAGSYRTSAPLHSLPQLSTGVSGDVTQLPVCWGDERSASVDRSMIATSRYPPACTSVRVLQCTCLCCMMCAMLLF